MILYVINRYQGKNCNLMSLVLQISSASNESESESESEDDDEIIVSPVGFPTTISVMQICIVKDTNITFCNQEVLMLFTDNYDWEELRYDLVPGVLQSNIISMDISTIILN